MIALDTNLLVYAHRTDAAMHAQASAIVRQVGEGAAPWALPWPCVHEFYSTVTSTKWRPQTSPSQAIAVVRALLASPSARLLGEGANHLEWLEKFAARGNVHGGGIHDARIAAICLSHGVRELWTADRDFSRFPELKTRNPLAA